MTEIDRAIGKLISLIADAAQEEVAQYLHTTIQQTASEFDADDHKAAAALVVMMLALRRVLNMTASYYEECHGIGLDSDSVDQGTTLACALTAANYGIKPEAVTQDTDLNYDRLAKQFRIITGKEFPIKRYVVG